MNRSFFIITFISTLLLLACDAEVSKQAISKNPPNIILVMADDQGWGDMAYNGHPVIQTPNFDKLAANAIRFDHFYAAAPVCSPTRGSVMTGRHPNRFECFTWGKTLRPQEMTLAEMLQANGYVTGHFGKWHLGSVRSGDPVNPGNSGFDEWFSAPNFFDNNPILSRNGIAEKTEGESSMVTVDAALEFIQKHANGPKPYLAVVWFGSPHLPHEAIEDDRKLYEDQEEDLQHFYGEMTGMDRAFGKLHDVLRSMDENENTILWYCSDNGGLPRVGSTGGRGHKAHIYEGGLRVPSILEWPARYSNHQEIDIPANTSDIFPTLMEIAGINLPDRPLDGISLLEFMDGKADRREKPMGFWRFPSPGVRTPSKEWMAELYEAQQNGNILGDTSRIRLEAGRLDVDYPQDTLPGHAAWLDWPYKLHRIADKEGSIHFELYNLMEDSAETRDLSTIESEAQRLQHMQTALNEWQQSVINSMNGEDYFYQVNKTAQPLRLDGKGSDSGWKQAELLTDFRFPWQNRPAPPTKFRALWDSDYLYFQFVVEDEDVVMWEGEDQDASVLGSDRVELFFSVNKELNPYYSLEMDPRAWVFSSKGVYHRKIDRNWSWEGLETFSSLTDDGYILEGRMPMESLEKLNLWQDPQKRELRVGVFRAEFDHLPGGEVKHNWMSWITPDSPTPDFHIPSAFGKWILKD